MLWDPFLYCINDSIQGKSETDNKVFVLPSKVSINNQEAIIKKFSLDHDPNWLSLTFVNRIYRINRRTRSVQWSNDAFELKLFAFLPIIVRFWEADDEFPASLQIPTDMNILDYMHYETLMFALTHLFHRIKEEMQNEKR